MKALSIRQPWAELILQRKKIIEIRSWNTKFRGYFLIHSSKRPETNVIKIFNLNNILYGYILGYAKLSNVIVYKSKEEFVKDKNKHLSINEKTKYPAFGFVLTDIHKIKPIKYKGNLGFFNVPKIKFKDVIKI